MIGSFYKAKRKQKWLYFLSQSFLFDPLQSLAPTAALYICLFWPFLCASSCHKHIPPSVFKISPPQHSFTLKKTDLNTLLVWLMKQVTIFKFWCRWWLFFQMKENIRERLSCVNKPSSVWLDWLSFSKHDDWVDFTHMIHLLLILTIMQQ